MVRQRHDDGEAVKSDGRVLDPGKTSVEREPLGPKDEEAALRPHTFSEFIGQRKVADNLGVYVSAAKLRNGTLDHILLSGPPGLGKTTLAHVIAHEMGTQARVTSGPALERKGDLAGILTSMGKGDVLFIDEIHRLQPVIEESLYPAMEDFHIEIVTGVGAGASAITVPIERFTLVGATTRTGQLTSPLLSRFGIVERLEFYAPTELATIVTRSARLLGIAIDESGAQEIGRRARGTPRIANRLLRRVHDFSLVQGDGVVTQASADYALKRLGVDRRGLDEGDRRLLRAIIERFDGGPVGIESLAAALAEDRDTLEYVHEPYLIQEGFLIRTPRGRQATPLGYEHLGIPLGANKAPQGGQGTLF